MSGSQLCLSQVALTSVCHKSSCHLCSLKGCAATTCCEQVRVSLSTQAISLSLLSTPCKQGRLKPQLTHSSHTAPFHPHLTHSSLPSSSHTQLPSILPQAISGPTTHRPGQSISASVLVSVATASDVMTGPPTWTVRR